MRRIALLLILAPLLIVLSGCSLISNLTGGDSNKHSAEEENNALIESNLAKIDSLRGVPVSDIAEARFGHIVEIIETKDSEQLKSLFSEKALAEAVDFDTSMERLFSLIDGEVVSWKHYEYRLTTHTGTHNGRNSGEKSRNIKSWFHLSTSTDTYALFLVDYDYNTIDSSYEGLYTIRVARAADEKTYFTTWQKMKIPGIYIPEEYFLDVSVAVSPEAGVQAE